MNDLPAYNFDTFTTAEQFEEARKKLDIWPPRPEVPSDCPKLEWFDNREEYIRALAAEKGDWVDPLIEYEKRCHYLFNMQILLERKYQEFFARAYGMEDYPLELQAAVRFTACNGNYGHDLKKEFDQMAAFAELAKGAYRLGMYAAKDECAAVPAVDWPSAIAASSRRGWNPVE